MKKFSSPQVIILLDFIFVFLLILITQKPAEIKINLPENRLNDTKFVIVQNGHISHFLSAGVWQDISKLKNRNFKYSTGFYIDTKCNSLCSDIPKPNISRGELRILITGKLYSRIANTLLGACKHNSTACSDIEIDITKNGFVNKKLLVEKNPIFKEIFE